MRSFASSDTPYENDRIDYYDYSDNDTGINCDDNDGGHDDRGVVMVMALRATIIDIIDCLKDGLDA